MSILAQLLRLGASLWFVSLWGSIRQFLRFP